MGTFESFRKAYGALKDSTMVGLAKVNSGFKDLDIAILKATNHVECPPKERHVRKIFAATSVVVPRADVAYCIHALSRRLAKTRSWIVAIKTLIVIHRTLREGDPTFREELLNYAHRGHVFQISNFKDDSSPLAWDCSAWVRTYALFLEERLECFRTLRYDIETERFAKITPGASKGHSRTRLMSGDELSDQLPALQQLLYRLVGCQPEGAAYHNYLIQYALALVLKESFKIYCAINDGIINLVDLFFDMSKHEAVKALNIYKRAGRQAESLADFYDFSKHLDVARNFQFPTLRQPPPSFLATMEEYVKEAPLMSGVPNKRPEQREIDDESEKIDEPTTPQESEKQEQEEEIVDKEEVLEKEEEPHPKEEEEEEEEAPPLLGETDDLLGLNKEVNPKALELEESNAMALAIFEPAGKEATYNGLNDIGKTSGWELALVTTPSNHTSSTSQTNLGGGFDKLLLDSLYEDDAARRQLQLQNAGYDTGYGYGMTDAPNSFNHQHDPFAMSTNIAPPTNVQMAMLQQQQQQFMMMQQQQQQQQQPNMLVPYHQQQGLQSSQYQEFQYSQQHQTQYSQQHYLENPNPFGDPFSYSHSSIPQQGSNHTLL